MSTLSIRSMLVAATVAALVFGCTQKETPDTQQAAEHGDAEMSSAAETAGMSEDELLHKADPVGRYGTGLTLTAQTELASILAEPESFEGKKVQVTGVVNEVCPKRGCWIELEEPHGTRTIRVKVTDGEIVFPLSAKDQAAVVEGTVERIELDEEGNCSWQAHLAEERGEAFDPESVTGPAVIWRIRGEGAQIGS